MLSFQALFSLKDGISAPSCFIIIFPLTSLILGSTSPSFPFALTKKSFSNICLFDHTLRISTSRHSGVMFTLVFGAVPSVPPVLSSTK